MKKISTIIKAISLIKLISKLLLPFTLLFTFILKLPLLGSFYESAI